MTSINTCTRYTEGGIYTHQDSIKIWKELRIRLIISFLSTKWKLNFALFDYFKISQP